MNEALKEALHLGRELYAQRDFLRAEPYLSQVADNAPGYADVFNMLGVIYHHLGQFSRAQQAFEHAVSINPSYTEANLNLAVTYNDMGRYADAMNLYSRALSVATRPGAKLDTFAMGKIANQYADIADAFWAAGAYDEAVGEFQRALQLRPTFIDIRRRFAECLREAGRPEAAIHELRTVLAQQPDDMPAQLHLGLTLFSVGEVSEAKKMLRILETNHPEKTRANHYLRMIESYETRQQEQKPSS